VRRWWWTVSFLMLLTLPLDACTGGEVGDEETDPNDDGSLEVVAVWTGGEQQVFQEILNAFADESGIEASYEASDDLGSFIGAQIEGGSPPDVAMVPQPGLIQELVDQDALQPIGDDARANLEEHYAPIWSELGTFNDELYAIYFKVASKSTWWYNVNALQQTGVQPPEAWGDMIEAARTTSQAGLPWYAIGAGDAWPLTDLFENVYLHTAGPDSYDQLAAHEIKWTDQSVIEALSTMGELFADDFMPGGRRRMLQTGFADSVPMAFSDPPETATVYEGDFVAGVINSETSAAIGETADFFEFPSVDGGEGVVGGGDGAVLLTDNPAAQEFVAFLASPEAAQIWAGRGGFISPNQSVDIGTYPDETSQRIAEHVTGAEVFRFDLSDQQPAEFGATSGRGMWQRMQEFFENPDDPQEAARNLEADAARAFP